MRHRLWARTVAVGVLLGTFFVEVPTAQAQYVSRFNGIVIRHKINQDVARKRAAEKRVRKTREAKARAEAKRKGRPPARHRGK